MGSRVTATIRNPQRLAGLGAEIISTADLPKHVRPGMLVSKQSGLSRKGLGRRSFCARLLNVPVTGASYKRAERLPRFANNRRAGGSAIRKALGIELAYPSYRIGVPAAL